MRSTTANQCHIITYLFTETFEHARFQWQNEFVRFRRVLVKREIPSLYHSKWELLRVITKKREERKRNWKAGSIFHLFKSYQIWSFYQVIRKKNSRFLGAINLKQTQNAIDNNFAKPFLCTCTNAMKWPYLNRYMISFQCCDRWYIDVL